MKERRGISPLLTHTALDIDAFEDKFIIGIREKIQTIPHGKILAISSKHESEEIFAKRDVPLTVLNPKKAINDLVFSNDFAQFRGPNALTRVEITFFSPIEKNFIEKISNSFTDTLNIEYSCLLRDRLCNKLDENSSTTKFPVKKTALEDLPNSVEKLQRIRNRYLF